MSAYKQLLASDIIVSPLKAHKTFTISGSSDLTANSIDRLIGTNEVFSTTGNTTGFVETRYQSSVYDFAKQSYYSNYLSGSLGSPVNTASFNQDGTVTGPYYEPAFDNYLETTLSFPKEFPTGSGEKIGVISIPNELYGDYIKPGTFRLTSGSLVQFIDDGEGNIYYGTRLIGNIFYSHGTVILTEQGNLYTGFSIGEYGDVVYGDSGTGSISIIDDVITSEINVTFRSTQTIYETQYKCTLGDTEFNATLNPSSMTEEGVTNSNITGSDFQPYITTVGLYNDNKELLAIGRMAKPVQKLPSTDLSLLINIDR